MSRRRKNGNSHGVPPVQASRRLSLATVVFGLACSFAGGAAVSFISRPVKPEVQVSQVQSSVAPIVTVSPSNVIFDRLKSLPYDRQVSLLEYIFARVDVESGMGVVYDSIIINAKVDVINEDDLRALARTDSIAARAVRRMPPGRTVSDGENFPVATRFGYNPELARVVRRNVAPDVDLAALLKHGLTLKGQHATMCLAHVFELHNPERELRSWLYNNNVINDKDDIDYDSLTSEMINYVAQNFLRNPVATRNEVKAYLKDYMNRATDRRLIGRVGIQVLAPRIRREGEKVVYDLPPSAVAELFSPNPVQSITPRHVSVLMGYALRSEVPAEVKLMEFLGQATGLDGRPLDNVANYVQGLRDPEGLRRSGENHLVARSNKLQAACKKTLEAVFNSQ